MGVRGLQTYLEQYSSEACYSVNITEIVQEYNSKTGQTAEIVVDAQSCYHLWCQGMDWVTGFEIRDFIDRLEKFVDAFKKAGAKLVFFFGGLTPEKKRSAWILRRRKNLLETLDVVDILESGTKVIPKHFNSIPPNMGVTTSFILKYVLKCEVYMTVDECDEELIEYVERKNSFAIFGQDTDFIISDLKAIVLSARNLDLSTMKTLLYDRVKLAHELSISVSQLPFLSILAGNDFIPFSTINEFHRRTCRIDHYSKSIPFNVLMPELGRYIQKLPAEAPVDVIFKIISHDIFEKVDLDQIKLMQISYESYIVKSLARITPTDEWSTVLYVAKYRHKNTVAPTVVYSILSEQIFECSTAFEDLRKIHDKNPEKYKLPSATITRPLRKRLYGVLLHQKETPTSVNEWCGENTESYLKPVSVEPEFPTVHHPGLVPLWSDSSTSRMCDIRWELFLTSVHPEIKSIEWKSFDESLLLPTISLFYLYKERYLNRHEVDAILATIAAYPLYTLAKLKALKYEKLDSRAAHISVTVIRTYGLLLTLLASCGYPMPISADNAYLKFEGKLFQVKYNDCIKKKQRYNDLCENNDTCLKTFYKMKNKVYRDSPPRYNRGGGDARRGDRPTSRPHHYNFARPTEDYVKGESSPLSPAQ